MEADLKELRENTAALIKDEDMKNMEDTVKKYKQEWNKKKKGCMEVLDMISEGMDKPAKEVFVLLVLQVRKSLV